jgi:O-acetylserine/cysteine efflux transporter
MSAPFALLMPCVGALSSAIVFGEPFEPLRLTGMILMVVALMMIVLPALHVMRLLGWRVSSS